jgi:NAD-dependent deacetylase
MMLVLTQMEEATRSGTAEQPDLLEARARLRSARRVVALTGAGISAESGVPTFRGASAVGGAFPQPRESDSLASERLNGSLTRSRRHQVDALWRQFRPEDLATPEAFAGDPRLVWEWYAWRRELIAAVQPNAGHHALARLEQRVPEFLLATQNVDGLHALAGSRRVVELHGSIWRLRCLGCGGEHEDRAAITDLPPRCACGALLRPGVVWFGEALPADALEMAFSAARQADVVVVIGTSSLVYPAAAVPQAAVSAGAFVVEVNPERTPLSEAAAVSLRGRAAELLPRLVGDGQ